MTFKLHAYPTAPSLNIPRWQPREWRKGSYCMHPREGLCKALRDTTDAPGSRDWLTSEQIKAREAERRRQPRPVATYERQAERDRRAREQEARERAASRVRTAWDIVEV